MGDTAQVASAEDIQSHRAGTEAHEMVYGSHGTVEPRVTCYAGQKAARRNPTRAVRTRQGMGRYDTRTGTHVGDTAAGADTHRTPPTLLPRYDFQAEHVRTPETGTPSTHG